MSILYWIGLLLVTVVLLVMAARAAALAYRRPMLPPLLGVPIFSHSYPKKKPRTCRKNQRGPPQNYALLRARKDAAVKRLRRAGTYTSDKVLDLLAIEFGCGVEATDNKQWLYVDHPNDLTVGLIGSQFYIQKRRAFDR